MNILYLTNIPTPYRIDFFDELGKLCNLTVLYERKTAKNRETSWLNKKANNFHEIFLTGKNFGVEASLSFEVIKWLKKSDFDLIVIGGYSTPTGMLAINYLRMKKIPFVLNIDGGLIKKDKLLKYFIKKYYISSPTYWLSPGKSATKYLIHYGAQKTKIYEYPFSSVRENDISTEAANDDITKTQLKRDLGITEEKIVLTVGQIIHRKGIDVLIHSAKETRDIGFYIVGGEPTKEYEDLLKKWNVHNVHFVGFKNKGELSRFYMAADLFVLPTREDIWGLVINEALAKGIPVITTDKCVAGLELIESGVNGYIVPAGNSSSLRCAIEDLIWDVGMLKRMRTNNLRKIKSYTIESMAKRHFEIFDELYQGSRS